ncbi:cupredoxin domain-containing protein [Candidatus Daviesbacteria bacterium]|nr:cupredoxin domain-containing protein [Candidatus Daviesbacteria bacterium]
MSRNNLIIILAVVVILLVGGYMLFKSQGGYNPSQPSSTYTSSPSPSPSPATTSATAAQNVVTISSTGFNPSSITIKKGESVNWMNSDSSAHAVNSAVHPTHLIYPPLNLGTIQPGNQKLLIFPVAGTYKYHDHLNPSSTGVVVVQ